MVSDKTPEDLEKLSGIDKRIERLVEKKANYIKLWKERRDRQTPRLQKTISKNMSFISTKLSQIKKIEEKKDTLEERIKTLELQIQDKRKIIQTAQEKLRAFEDCVPGMNNVIRERND